MFLVRFCSRLHKPQLLAFFSYGLEASISLPAPLVSAPFFHLARFCVPSVSSYVNKFLESTLGFSAAFKFERCPANIILIDKKHISRGIFSKSVKCNLGARLPFYSLHVQQTSSRSLCGNKMFPHQFCSPLALFSPPFPQGLPSHTISQQYMFPSNTPMLRTMSPIHSLEPYVNIRGHFNFNGMAIGTPVRRISWSPFNSQCTPDRTYQQFPQDNNRHSKKLKRKYPNSDKNVASKVIRTQVSPVNTTLVNGAKPILHVPGLQCERITEAIAKYYNDHHQSESDLRHKIVLSNCLYAVVRDTFPGCRLFIVGSSLSGFGTRNSDMDLCLLVTQMQDIDQKFEAIHILNALNIALQDCSFIRSSQVIKAKVPILKFRDSLKNIECDLNINNGVGIRNTHLLKYYCLSDTRVAPLMLFIKYWARFHDINDAHKRTISSYSLALMLIHYLQVCTPPILPCLQQLYPERFDQNIDLRDLRLDEPLLQFVSKNTDSLGRLFQGFLDYYAHTFRPEYDVISVREGCVLNRRLVQISSYEPNQWKCLCIEEPFDGTNTARSVFDPNIFQRIRRVFRRSAQVLKKEGNAASVVDRPF